MLNRIVPEDLPFRHSCEGPDDMVTKYNIKLTMKMKIFHIFRTKNIWMFFQPAHVKACFLGSNLTVPLSDGKLNLGTWQGVWLCEHRDRAGSRKVRLNDINQPGCQGTHSLAVKPWINQSPVNKWSITCRYLAPLLGTFRNIYIFSNKMKCKWILNIGKCFKNTI